jgi:periplasmic protein TonB
MFEQALMPTTRNKPWTLGASLTLQCAIVGSMVLYSAVHVDVLPLNTRHLELPMPPVPKLDFIKVISSFVEPHAGSLTMLPRRVFTMPVSIPKGVPDSNDAGLEAPVLASFSGAGTSGASDGIFGSLFTGTAIVPAVKPPAPQTQVVKVSGPHAIGGRVLEAMILKRVLPVYPQLAKSARISGKVRLMGIISKDGTIQRLELLEGHPLLASAALAAVKQWIYRPTLLNGVPVDVTAPIEVIFTLTQ